MRPTKIKINDKTWNPERDRTYGNLFREGNVFERVFSMFGDVDSLNL